MACVGFIHNEHVWAPEVSLWHTLHTKVPLICQPARGLSDLPAIGPVYLVLKTVNISPHLSQNCWLCKMWLQAVDRIPAPQAHPSAVTRNAVKHSHAHSVIILLSRCPVLLTWYSAMLRRYHCLTGLRH